MTFPTAKPATPAQAELDEALSGPGALTEGFVKLSLSGLVGFG